MNERIKELAEQCWDKRLDGLHFDQEKFAELIVQECLAQADALRDSFESEGEDQQSLGAAWVGLAIARHFGVKE
jgi:hypothetical protein